MIDKTGKILKIGDTIITMVSKGSVYLTLAEILDLDLVGGKIFVSYLSTPKEKWIDPNKEEVMVYTPRPRELYSEVGLFKDNAGYKVISGDKVAWKNETSISIGYIGSIESDLWGILNDGTRVRNTQIIKL